MWTLCRAEPAAGVEEEDDRPCSEERWSDYEGYAASYPNHRLNPHYEVIGRTAE